MPEVADIAKDVYQLKADMAQINTLVDRLDITITKLTEVSTNISELLAVQTNRLETQEKLSSKLFEIIEKRKDESEQSDKDIQLQMKNLEKELYDEIEEKQEKILNELKSMKETNTKQHLEMSQRMTKLEKWIWIVTGGAIVVGFIISKVVAMLPKLMS